MKIAIIGTGYVGLVSGTCFAELGNQVTCVDIDDAKITRLSAGEVPIYEPGLDTLLTRNLAEKRVRFTTKHADAVHDADIVFLALPTPPREDGSADLSYVLNIAEQLGPLLQNYTVIVDKSTVPVGTAEKVADIVAKHTSVPFDVVSNPEFLREGWAVHDFMRPDRIVIGTTSDRAKPIMESLYEPFARQGTPLLFMEPRSAEIAKYASNSFLAAKISFINEIAYVCEQTGADVEAVGRAVGADPRIGPDFLSPGIGYGGSCFPKDTKEFVRSGADYGYELNIVKAAIAVNEQQPLRLVEKLQQYFDGQLQGKRFALWGLAFKPDTDDIREARSRIIIDELLAAGAFIQAFDPEARENIRALYGDEPNFTLADDQYQALEAADALLIVTEWQEFGSPDFDLIKQRLRHPAIFDGRNMYDPAAMEALGFTYASIGRRMVRAS